MDKSVFYIVCFLILQNITFVLCAGTTCATVEDCEVEVTALSKATEKLKKDIDKEINYITNEFKNDKQRIMEERDITKEHADLIIDIEKINTNIKEDKIATDCVTTANTDADTKKGAAETAKTTCGNKANEPDSTKLNELKGKTEDLISKINTATEKCNTPSSKIKNKYNYRYRENNVYVGKETDETEKIACLKDLLNTHSPEDIQTKFDEEKPKVHQVTEDLKSCLEKTKFADNVISELKTCVTEKYSDKIDSIKSSITKSETEFPDKINDYKDDKEEEVTGTINKPEYDTEQACTDLSNKIKSGLFAEKNPCVDSAKKVAENICKQNEICESTAMDKITPNVNALEEYLNEVKNLGSELNEKECNDKDFDKNLQCFQDLLKYDKDLNTINTNFDKTYNDDLGLGTCLITKDEVESDGDIIISNLATCKTIEELEEKRITLLRDINEKITYVDKEFETDKQNAINEINFDDKFEELDESIAAISEGIPKGSISERCVRNAEQESKDAVASVQESKSACGSQANKPSTEKLTELNTEVNKLNGISTDLTNCLKKEKLEDLEECLNEINGEYEPKIEQYETNFNSEKVKIDAVIPKLERCLENIKFDQITDNILPTLNSCVLRLSALADLQNNINKLHAHLNKEVSDHKQIITYIDDKFNLKLLYDNVLEEIQERGKNVTDEERKGCATNATSSIKSLYDAHTANQKQCKTTAENAPVLKTLTELASSVQELGVDLIANATETCNLEEVKKKEAADLTCEEIVQEYTTEFNDITKTINEDQIQTLKMNNLKTLTDCVTPTSTVFNDERTETMVELIDCINSASNLFLNNMLYICCFILMLMHLM